MKDLKFGEINHQVPVKFNELTAPQLYAIGYAMAQNVDVAESKLILIRKFFPDIFKALKNALNSSRLVALKHSRKARKKKSAGTAALVYKESMEDLNALAQLFSWIYNDKHVCDKWLLPTITHNGTTFYGPSDRFGNLEFWEYCKADIYYNRYQDNKHENDFYRFLACLYRVKNPNTKQAEEAGNLRVAFNDRVIDKNARAFIGLDPSLIYAISLNYVAFKRWLTLAFPNVFKSSGKAEKNNDDKPVNVSRTYTKLLMSIAKRRHQDEEAIAKKQCLMVFEDQEDEIEKVNAQEERIKHLRK